MFKNSVFKVSVSTKKWAKASAIRVIKTFAESVIGGLVIGKAFYEVDWNYVFSVAAVSAIIAFFTCLMGIPEVESEE